jgi:hypothetical protein
MDSYSALFGSGLCMNLMVERELCSRTERMILEDSSYMLLKSSANHLQKLNYHDYMGLDNPLKMTTNVNDLIVKGRI